MLKSTNLKDHVLNVNKNSSGRRKTERTQENIDLLQENLIEGPRISAR